MNQPVEIRMNEWMRAWLNVPGWVTTKEGYKTKWASTLNTETNRSFWHKDVPLIGFIWVHLLSGRQGTHPRDPSHFNHPLLHRHVPLCLPPMVPTQPCVIMAEIIMTTATLVALEKRECVGHRDKLKYLGHCWMEKINKQLWVEDNKLFVLREGLTAVCFKCHLWEHYLLKKVMCAYSRIQRKWDSQVQQTWSCALIKQWGISYPWKALIYLRILILFIRGECRKRLLLLCYTMNHSLYTRFHN